LVWLPRHADYYVFVDCTRRRERVTITFARNATMSDSDLRWAERRALLAGSSVFALTSIHHVYGAIRYDTPERYHAVLVGAAALIVMLIALRVSRARPASATGRAAWWTFFGVNATVFVLLFGAFEGLYNHALKVALYLGGTPVAQLRVLFPAPMYEMPNDWFFEVTGILQLVPAAVTAYYLDRLIRRRLAIMRTGCVSPERRLAPIPKVHEQTLSDKQRVLTGAGGLPSQHMSKARDTD
jgi:hypothetical protein